jgi:hypothetical protein
MVVVLDPQNSFKEEKAMEEKVTKGKVGYKEGKYFLDVAGKMEELPVGLLVDEKFLKEQVGQEVEVLYSTPRPAVVAIKSLRIPRIILCNIPAWEWVAGIITQPSAEMTRVVATKLLKEGVITQGVYDKMQQGIG